MPPERSRSRCCQPKRAGSAPPARQFQSLGLKSAPGVCIDISRPSSIAVPRASPSPGQSAHLHAHCVAARIKQLQTSPPPLGRPGCAPFSIDGDNSAAHRNACKAHRPTDCLKFLSIWRDVLSWLVPFPAFARSAPPGEPLPPADSLCGG